MMLSVIGNCQPGEMSSKQTLTIGATTSRKILNLQSNGMNFFFCGGGVANFWNAPLNFSFCTGDGKPVLVWTKLQQVDN
jgi:hypothetical protein